MTAVLTRGRGGALEGLGVIRAAATPCATLALASLVCVAGCSGGVSPVSLSWSSSVPAAVAPDAQHYEDDVYSAQPYSNNATVYKRKGSSLRRQQTLSTGLAAPQGSKATPRGQWYLTNAGDSNVLIYKTTKSGPKPVGTLNDAGEVPVNVDVTADETLVAVSNLTSAGSGTGSVSVFTNGASQPSRTLTYGSDLLLGQGVAIDRNGNCFWSFDDKSVPSAPGSIVEFAGCNGSGTLVLSGITSAGGMTFDRNGNLYYVDEASGIYKCQGTARCTLFASGFGLPVNMNFDAGEKHLWVADATGAIYAVNPQSGQLESETISIDGDPYGIAPAPGD